MNALLLGADTQRKKLFGTERLYRDEFHSLHSLARFSASA